MADILETILATKQREVAARKKARSLHGVRADAEAMPATRGFAAALAARRLAGAAAVISEIKKASPSAGLLRDPYQPADIAQAYARHGAACLSVLTDQEFFQGSPDHLVAARAACELPVLKKDFMIDPYQLFEARTEGADCILLIVAALDSARIKDLAQCAFELGLDVLVEVHDESELECALALDRVLLGVNNRNLRTFATSIETSLRLRPLVPRAREFVTESGVRTRLDVAHLRAAGIDAFLVGEALMRAPDPGAALAELFGA